MSKIISLTLSPEDAAFNDSINNHICKELNSSDVEPSKWKILKKSIDARKKKLKFNLELKSLKKNKRKIKN